MSNNLVNNEEKIGYENFEEAKDSFKIQNNRDFEEVIDEAFRNFDKDKSGLISKNELGNFLKELGYKLTEVELEEMMDDIDEDGNGFIGKKEFRNILTKSMKDELTITTCHEAFSMFDKYRTDKISYETLKDILIWKEGDNEFPDENEVNELLNSIFGSNTEIDYKEMVKDTFNIFGNQKN